ncbi:hypothetical protein PSTG_10793 [Puccinia striiformis f. sp. tritici PST-78]|uniref:DUF659 domain-containing protein n=1 Tax=Puccinia striiformis f. sp. tritici PST-78 TaxID=1165861 RepID=A0A0L0V9A7_9BASI|nr:hypothetical protein PSTG_10793 [Puccinia striiformis f. sp. tritici PST-78]
MAQHPQKRIQNQLLTKFTLVASNVEHALRLTHNKISATYAQYKLPILFNQLDKFKCRMIAWKCKICLKFMNRPAYDLSCSDIDPREVLQRCTVWCAEGAKPFLALEETSLKRVLHPTILKHLPNQKMVSKAIQMLYLCVQEKLCEDLKAHKGALYLGVDAWQSPNRYNILKERHTGEYLARMVKYIVEKFGIKNRICGIVSDNAANNGMMIAELEKLNWERFKGEPQWIQCYAHILNLIVKVILQQRGGFNRKVSSSHITSNVKCDSADTSVFFRFNEEEENSDVNDDEEEIGDIPAAANGELAEDDKLTLANIEDLNDEDENDAYTSDLCCQTLAKVCLFVRKSPNSKARSSQICEESQCKKPHTIKCDVSTQWNSPYLQLSSIVRCKDASTKLTYYSWQRDKQFGTPHNHHVKQEDFDLAANLVQVLQRFYELTLQLSIKTSACVAGVVVMINQITTGLSADEYFKLAKWPKD